MKKLLFIALTVISSICAFAQTESHVTTENSRKLYNGRLTREFTKPNGLKHLENGSRSTSVSFDIYYPGIEEAFALDNSKNYVPNYAETINKRLPVDTNSRFKSRWGVVLCDKLFNLDSSTGFPLIQYDLSQVTMRVDSLYCRFVHDNTSGAMDTIIFKIYDFSTISFTNAGGISGTLLWSDTIYTDTSLSETSTSFADRTYYPNLTLAKGKTIAIQADFYGPITDEFSIQNSTSDNNCPNPVNLVDTAYVRTSFGAGMSNSRSSFVVGSGPGTVVERYSDAVYFDLNGNGSVSDCENYYVQNLWLIPSVTLTVDLSASPLILDADGNARNEFCPGEIASVQMNVAGNSGPYTVSWSPTTGVDDPSSPNVNITVGATTTNYTVTITEGTTVVTKTVTIRSNGINVNAGADQTISCGSTANISAAISGVTTTPTYTWSNGITTAANNGVYAGIYTVTVRNNKGCTATDVVEVKYPGVSQVVGFNVPSPICVSATYPATFLNTSAKKTGWNFTWTNVTDGGVNSFLVDGQFTFAAAGSKVIRLEADSAGCKFLTSSNINVKAASDPLCRTWSVENIDFSNNVSIFPNPNSGMFDLNIESLDNNVTISVSDVSGRVVYTESTQNITSYKKNINLGSVASGVYYVKVQSGENTTVKKLVIQ